MSILDNTYLFVVTHWGSGFPYLDYVLDRNPRVAADHTDFTYTHPLQLSLLREHHHNKKVGNKFAQIYTDSLVENHAFSCKRLYEFCKFIYLVRPAEPTLSELLAEKKLEPASVEAYYRFRLQRMAEMAKQTPGGLLVTWNELANGQAFKAIESYLGLKMPLDARNRKLAREYFYQPPESMVRNCERAYNDYVSKIQKRLKVG